MKKTATPKQVRLLLATGLLIIAGAQWLSRFAPIPDLIIGGFMGIGIGLEILALIRFKADKA